MSPRRTSAGLRNVTLRYAVAVIASASAVLLRYALHSALGNDEPLFISPLAVVVSAVIGGFGPGLAATILTALGAAYFFLEPEGFAVGLANDRSRLLAFLIVGTLISLLSGALHRSRRRARETSAEMESSRRRIADILSSITDCYFEIDPAGRMIKINEKAAAYLDVGSTGPVGRNLRDLFPAPEGILSAFEQVKAGGGPVHFEGSSVIRAGRWTEVHAYPTNGGMSVYFRDINERKQAEENLARESALNATFADLAHALVGSPSVAEISDLVLQRAKRLTQSSIGYVGFLDPQSGRFLTPTKEHEVCESCGMAERCPVFRDFTGPWGKVLREGRPIMMNEPIVQSRAEASRADEDPRRHVLVNRFLSAPATIDRDVVGQIAVANAERDYTIGDLYVIERLASLYAIAIQRNWADEKIRESQERYRGLYEAIPGGVVVHDREGMIIEVNPGAAAIFGLEVEEIRGGMWRDPRWRMIHEDGSPFADSEFPPHVAIRTGKRVRGVVAGIFPLGATTPVWVLINCEPVLDPETGEVEAAVSTFVDISDRKIATEEVARARQEADAANAAKDRFLAVLSHELRTPLTPILLATGLLQKDERLPSDLAEEVHLIHRNVEVESRLIDDLLDLNRITRGKFTLDRKSIDVRVVLRSTIEICAPDIEERGLELKTDIEDATETIHADSVRLRQAFWNIVKNALKFTPTGGTISIRAGNTGGNGHRDGLGNGLRNGPPSRSGIFVEISDTGIGIDPEVLPRVFDPFEQGDIDVTRRFGGLGLGLAIAKTIVELHGGGIRASSPGRNCGTTFRIEIPCHGTEPGMSSAGHSEDYAI